VGLIRKSLNLIGVLIGDALDRWSDPAYPEMADSLRKAVERASELALDVARLEEENDDLQHQVSFLEAELDKHEPDRRPSGYDRFLYSVPQEINDDDIPF
jgi:hypothetical protein